MKCNITFDDGTSFPNPLFEPDNLKTRDLCNASMAAVYMHWLDPNVPVEASIKKLRALRRVVKRLSRGDDSQEHAGNEKGVKP